MKRLYTGQMTNLALTDIDPTYLTDNYPDYYCCRVIKTEQRLQALVADALALGTLNISYCIVNVEFDLYNLLKQCEQPKILEKEGKIKSNPIDCPFYFFAHGTRFCKFLILDSVIFKQTSIFSFAKFLTHLTFSSTIFSEETEEFFSPYLST